tara:strand:+ start:278 stop:1090 length:813 start_codon:yes stop_codon:yes gene_type:complete
MSNSDKSPANGLQGNSYLYDYGTSPNTRTAVSQKVRILTPVFGENTALHQMGVLSSFAPNQSRAVDPVRGIGFGDQVAELVPGVTEPTTSSFERALLYLCNLWQATGYAAGVDGPVRSLAHHRWPFDVEQQLVFSTLADADLGVANQGYAGSGFDGGTKQLGYNSVTNYPGDETVDVAPAENRGHSAIITMYEACWFTDWSATFGADSGMIMESGSFTASDVHDFSSYYGEFLATGNDPTIGQLGSLRYGSLGGAGGGAGYTTGNMTGEG